MINIIINKENIDQFKILINKPTSLNKFNVGGADIFLEHKKNHQTDILGININKPLLISNLRFIKRS